MKQSGAAHDDVSVDIEAPPSKIQGHARSNAKATDNSANGPGRLEFADVTVDVGPKESRKRILHGISGNVDEGDMMALMGPSGSGKTTLLQCLACRPTGTVGGRMEFDGKAPTNATRRRVGLVTQTDIMWESLTVWDTLRYAAEFRLPQSMGKKEKDERVRQVTEELGLQNCLNTIVGGYQKPGISGGEKKRVSIALELLARPSLLILDEPTSGLDASIALKVVNVLRELSHERRMVSIVLSIHQPATRIFKAMNNLLVLSRGESLYRGSPDNLPKYFEGLGHPLPADTNPADWILDIASADFYSSSVSKGDADRELRRLLDAHYEREMKPKLVSKSDSTAMEKDERWEWPTSWMHQVLQLIQRNSKAKSSDKLLDPWKIGEHTLIGIVAGLLWFNVDDGSYDSVQDVGGLLFLLVTANAIAPIFEGLFAFPFEQMLVRKEKSSGWYRLSAYYIAKTLGDIPVELIQPTIITIIAYWMAGLRKEASAFFGHLFTIYYATLTASTFGMAFSAMFLQLKKAQSVTAVFIIATLLLGGFFIENLPSFIEWLQFFSFIRYPFAIVLKIQYPKGDKVGPPCAPESVKDFAGDLPDDVDRKCSVRKEVLENIFSVGVELPIWKDTIGLTGFFVALRIGVYFLLKWRLSNK